MFYLKEELEINSISCIFIDNSKDLSIRDLFFFVFIRIEGVFFFFRRFVIWGFSLL